MVTGSWPEGRDMVTGCWLGRRHGYVVWPRGGDMVTGCGLEGGDMVTGCGLGEGDILSRGVARGRSRVMECGLGKETWSPIVRARGRRQCHRLMARSRDMVTGCGLEVETW